jgi:haloalkane dehalogenase
MSDNHKPTVPSWLDRAAYPFKHRWLELTGGRRMHYIDEGEGEALLFVHGTPTWSFEWRHLVRELSKEYRCIAPDLVGMGLSDRPSDFAYTPEAHAQSLIEFARRLSEPTGEGRKPLDRFTLVLHDYGGPIGLPILFQSPARVNGVVLINTWAWSFEDDAFMAGRGRMVKGALGRFMYRWLNAPLRLLTPSVFADRKKLTREIHAQYLAVFPDRHSRGQVLWPFARAILGSSAFYDGLWRQLAVLRQKPVLIVWGMKDDAFRPYMLERWCTALPEARVLELPVGHWPHEEAPQPIVSALREFMSAPTTTVA